MVALQVSGFLMVVVCGLWSGVILTFAVERTVIWARMPIEQFAVDFRRSTLRVDPMQPILALVAALAAATFVWQSAGGSRWLAALGLGLIISVVIASIIIAEPINSQFRRLSEGQVPDRTAEHRATWRRFHRARTAAALAAFVCLAGAVVV